ncbi:MAG: DUF1028 domain-containing protein [Saprospiraceae bacterium]|nr:DUF1028 domain-containing protein [Saprospiraceae bacterium]
MNRTTLLALTLWLMCQNIQAQDTFSIVALDTLTGEIGSAGASCLDNNSFPGSGGAIIISDIIPGKGAIHTQASWTATNQNNAHQKMVEGLSPSEIITWLKQNDVQGPISAQTRQYGIVDFGPQGQPRSAAFTGTNCYNWKGHRLGTIYSIQGNILLGPEILDSIEARFLTATGTLSDRLMAALQGANVPGADTRCLPNGTSSLSAFLRVAKTNDHPDSLSLDLNVPSLPTGQEPIDSLQSLYNAWKASVNVHPTPAITALKISPNPASGFFEIALDDTEGQLELTDATGKTLFTTALKQGVNRLTPGLNSGVYFVRVLYKNGGVGSGRLVWKG